MSTQGNVTKRTVPVMLLRAAGAIAVLSCLAALAGMITLELALMEIGSGGLVVAAVVAVAALIARVAR